MSKMAAAPCSDKSCDQTIRYFYGTPNPGKISHVHTIPLLVHQ
jgi:hypothetical protein